MLHGRRSSSRCSTRMRLSLAEAGLVAAAPTVGVMLPGRRGMVSDRRGKRFLLAGLVATTVAGAAAALVGDSCSPRPFLAGAARPGTTRPAAASWWAGFPPGRRGLAMGIRQMAQPVGVGIAAVSIAVVAAVHGAHTALWVPTIAAARRPSWSRSSSSTPRARTPQAAPRPRLPARRVLGSRRLGAARLTSSWSGLCPGLARPGSRLVRRRRVPGRGRQVEGTRRILVGHLSDRVGGKLRPLRWVAVAAAVVMALLSLARRLVRRRRAGGRRYPC